MADDFIKVSSKAEVRTRFSTGIKKLVESANTLRDANTNKGQRKQPALDKNGWDGDLTNFLDMHKPWSLEEVEQDFVAAISDATSPGTVSDLMSTSIQGDWLAQQSRAFRLRHMTPIRASAHVAARRAGHGHEGGLFNKGVVNYAKGITKLGKDL